MSLSICMIIRNEQENLKKLLPRLQLFLNTGMELIIVDTGSTDESINIVKQYTNNIYTFRWENNFSSARNYSIAKATKDWILILDADEIPKFSPKELKKIISSMEKKDYNSALVFIKFMSKSTFTLDRQIRIFKKSDFVYEGKIFNRLKGKQRLASSNLTIENYGNLLNSSKDKIKKDIELLEEITRKDNSLFYKYQLLNKYFELKEYKKVLDLAGEFVKYLKTAEKINPLYLKAFILAGKAANELKNYDQAIMLYQIVLKYYPKFLDAYLFLAETHSHKKNYEESIKYLEKYIDLHREITGNIFDPTLPPIDTLPLKLQAMRGLLRLYIDEKQPVKFRKYLKDYIKLETDTQRLVKVINTFPPYPELLVDIVKDIKELRMALYGLHIYATKKIKPRNYKHHMIFLYENTKHMTPAEITWFANIMKQLVNKEKAIEIYEKYLNECADSQKEIIRQLIQEERNA